MILMPLVFLFAYTKICWAELKCERMRERNDSRYEQFEIFPDAIE